MGDKPGKDQDKENEKINAILVRQVEFAECVIINGRLTC